LYISEQAFERERRKCPSRSALTPTGSEFGAHLMPRKSPQSGLPINFRSGSGRPASTGSSSLGCYKRIPFRFCRIGQAGAAKASRVQKGVSKRNAPGRSFWAGVQATERGLQSLRELCRDSCCRSRRDPRQYAFLARTSLPAYCTLPCCCAKR
jgi:hypothetical protein